MLVFEHAHIHKVSDLFFKIINILKMCKNFFKPFKFKKLKIWSFIAFAIFCTSSVFAASSIKVDVTAKGAILMNAETGNVLWEKNAHVPLYPSSTTKMFTALYALEKQGFALDEMVTASHEAVNYVHPNIRRAANGAHPPYRLEFGGTHMGIKPGETLPLRVLLYGLMLVSGNDAANVIAQHVSGNISAFMKELNLYVREKGCKNTTLLTPHGLPQPEHKTTAYDMAIIAKEALKNPIFREIVKTTQYPRPATNKHLGSTLHQHNALVRPGKFYYPKAIGIKTGYTTSGGFSIVSAAEDAQRKLIVVLLGCDKIEDRYREAIALFEAGFNEKKVARTLFSKGFDLFSYAIEGAKAPLQAQLVDDVVLEYYPSEEPMFKAAITWGVPPFPIAAGQKVGEMRVLSQDGKCLSSTPIYAVKEVGSTFGHQMRLLGREVKRGLKSQVTLIMILLGVIVLGGSFTYSLKRAKFHKGK